jgi:hypothetical protein
MTIDNPDETDLPGNETPSGDSVDKLPPCHYRELTERPFIFFCRHTAVRSPQSLVVGSMCALCSVRETPCKEPRKLPGAAEDAAEKVSPPWYQKVWNLTTSVASFVADGMKTVNKEQYDERLAICSVCAERKGNSCTRCGCNLTLKAQGRAFECPLSKWPKIPKDAAP